MTERGRHPDVGIAHLDRAARYIVRPEVEGAAALVIEAGVVPMTGQDAVLDSASLEREAHVGATIVEDEDAPALTPAIPCQIPGAKREMPPCGVERPPQALSFATAVVIMSFRE
jgi:hypothetical protein